MLFASCACLLTSCRWTELADDLATTVPKSVHLRGTVTASDDAWNILVIQTAQGGVKVENPSKFPTVGQEVDAGGLLSAGNTGQSLLRATVVSGSGRSIIAARRVNTKDLTSLDNQFRKVEIAGVVRSSTLERNGRLSLSLRADETDVQVRVVNDMGVEGETLVDARIAVSGVVDIAYDVSNHAIGAVLWVNDPSDIRVVEFPRVTASTSIESAGAIQGLDPKNLPIHRVRLHGGIGLNAATGQMQFHDETGSIPIETNLQFLTRGANKVDVLGFLTANQGHTVLSFPTIQENKLLASTEHGISPEALIAPEKSIVCPARKQPSDTRWTWTRSSPIPIPHTD